MFFKTHTKTLLSVVGVGFTLILLTAGSSFAQTQNQSQTSNGCVCCKQMMSGNHSS